MKRQKAGKLDRHIQIQRATPSTDPSGDEIDDFQDWNRLWAERKERGAYREVSASQELLRDSDVIFLVRSNSISREIAPELYRVTYKGRVHEIIGIGEGNGTRADLIALLCCYRPDGRGARAPGQDTANP